MLPDALCVAREIGITRLADITRLDRVGLPCWQAVRPMGRSLSVHQGKGHSDDQARLGAILEALEAHCAEGFGPPDLVCRFDELPDDIRPLTLADFAKDSAVPIETDRALEWVVVPTSSGGAVAVPWACVSMDFTIRLRTRLDRSSNGVACGSSREEAIVSSLLELIERDAVTEWKAGTMLDRMSDEIDLDRCPWPWVDAWRDRLRGCGAFIRCYVVPSLVGMPVVACELGDSGKSATPFHAIHGHAAHSDPEVALFRAMAEAVQGRAAYIAGARDDLMPSQYRRAARSIHVAFAMPRAASIEGRSPRGIARGPAASSDIVAAIERCGLGPVVIIDLDQAGPFHVVRTLALGLASRRRRRRAIS